MSDQDCLENRSGNRFGFVKGAVILAAAGLVAKVIGAVFRIVLAAILGDEGIGLYQYAYPIYTTLLVISTAGVPVAVSIIMAEKIALKNYGEAIRVFRIAFSILALTGLLISTVLLLGAEYIAVNFIRDDKAIYPLVAIAPAILFVTVMASLRGYFQGQQDMVPTAASQLVEQLVRVGFSIVMVLLLLPVGLDYAAAGATSGAAAGGLAGLLLLAYYYRNKRWLFQNRSLLRASGEPDPAWRVIRRIFSLAIPVTIGSLVIPLITMIDLAVVPRQLQASGFDIERARALYGQLTGMAGSVVYFPAVLATALSMSLVPAISEAFALNNMKLIQYRCAVAVKLTVLFALPSAAGLFLLAEPVTVLLFSNAEAGFSLAFMAWSVISLCLYISTTGLIQGLGRPLVPALNMLYGGLVKTVLAWYLTAIPSLNVGGAALASVAGITVAAVLNLVHLRRHTGWRGNLRELVLVPGLATLVMALVVYVTYHGLYAAGFYLLAPGRLNALSTLTAIAAGLVVYVLLLLISGGVKKEEIAMLPLIGPALANFAGRLSRARPD